MESRCFGILNFIYTVPDLAAILAYLTRGGIPHLAGSINTRCSLNLTL
jgi:hypothetical protein